MKHTIPALKAPRSDLAARFARYRRNARLGAVALVSLSTLRALSAVEQREAGRIARSVYTQGRTDDGETAQTLPEGASIMDRAARSPLLSPSEHAAIQAARPSSRSVIWRKPAVVTDDADEPLPAGFTPGPIAPYESAFLPMSPELAAIEAQARDEAAAEVAQLEAAATRDAAAVAFRSDYDAAAPIDYTPAAPAVVRALPATPIAPVMTGEPITDHAALLAAILGNSTPRRVTMAAR